MAAGRSRMLHHLLQVLAQRPHLIRSGVLLGLVLVVSLFPVRTNVASREEDPDSQVVTPLDDNHSVTITFTAPVSFISGLVLHTNADLTVSPAASLEAQIQCGSGSHQRERVITRFWSSSYSPHDRTIRLLFWPLMISAGERCEATVQAPHVLSDPSIPIRKEIVVDHDAEPSSAREVAFDVLATQPLGWVLYTKLAAYDTEGEDVYYSWHAGGDIIAGNNPYRCGLSNTCLDKKYPIYFPLFYWLSALTRRLGFEDYPAWIALWRPIFVAAYLGIAALIARILYQRGWIIVAGAGTLFWLGNRWSLYVLRVGHIDFLALFCLLLSLVLFKKRPWLALLLLGVSLGIKQVAIFIVPLYLIWMWHRSRQQRLQRTLLAAGAIGAIPLLAALPFLFDNAPAVIESVFFSATRVSTTSFAPEPLSVLIGAAGPARLGIMLVIMSLLYLAAAWRQVSPYSAVLLIFATFAAFNPVLFDQYYIWMIPFIPLAVADSALKRAEDITPPGAA